MLVRVAGQRLVDGVVDDLPHQVVQAALAGGADVHAGALADRLEPLEDLDRGGVVLALLDRVALAHRRERERRPRRRRRRGCRSAGDAVSLESCWCVAGGVLAGISSATSHPLHVCRHSEGRPRNRGDDRLVSIPRSRARFRRVCPHSVGVNSAAGEADSRPHRAHWTAAQGRVLVPVPARGPQIARDGPEAAGTGTASGPGLSRRCRADPRPSRTERSPRFQLGPCGPSTSISVTVPSPELLVEPADDGRGEQLHLGRPRRRVGADHQLPPASVRSNDSGVQCCATSRPTSISQRENTPCTRTSVPQPCSAISRPIVASSSCGSRSSGCAPEAWVSTRRRAGRNFDGGAALARTPSALRRAASDRAMLRARSRPDSSCVRAARAAGLLGGSGPRDRRGRRGRRLRRHRAAPSRPPRRSARRPAPPARRAATAAVTSTCSAPATSSASRSRRSVSSSAKTSSRIRIGSSPVGAQQVVGRQPQRERHRPGLAVARRSPSPAAARSSAPGRRGAGRPG